MVFSPNDFEIDSDVKFDISAKNIFLFLPLLKQEHAPNYFNIIIKIFY